jgi:hypothetical protein
MTPAPAYTVVDIHPDRLTIGKSKRLARIVARGCGMVRKGQEAIVALQGTICQLDTLGSIGSADPTFKRWYRDTAGLVDEVFGYGSRHTRTFAEIIYACSVERPDTTSISSLNRFLSGLKDARAALEAMVKELQESSR